MKSVGRVFFFVVVGPHITGSVLYRPDVHDIVEDVEKNIPQPKPNSQDLGEDFICAFFFFISHELVLSPVTLLGLPFRSLFLMSCFFFISHGQAGGNWLTSQNLPQQS